jgi:hypothetical protein
MLDYADRRNRQTAVMTKVKEIEPAPQLLGRSTAAKGGTRATSKPGTQHVSAPWGWPGHQKLNGDNAARPGASARMQSFVNRLVRQRELVSSPSNNPRISGSVRALLEDRYGRINKDGMESIEYSKVKRPLLRDPSEFYDQMDDFDSRESDRIQLKIMNVVSMSSHEGFPPKNPDFRYVAIKDVKQPWGW